MMDWRSQSRNQIYTRGSQGKSTDRVERLDKMPKIVRFLAIDQEGVITVWPWRGPHAIYEFVTAFFFFGKDNHLNNDVKNFLSKHAKPAKGTSPWKLGHLHSTLIKLTK
jgi:hypothetical protein